MPQLTVEDGMEKGFPGQLADIGPKTIDSYMNRGGQIDTVTVVAADIATTVTINGTAFAVNVAEDAKTTTELAVLLVAAINGGSELVEAANVAAVVTVISTDPDNVTTYVATANVTLANLVAFEAAMPFGILVVQDPNRDNGAILPINAEAISGSLLHPENTPHSVLGVTVHQFTIEQQRDVANNVGYPSGNMMSVLRRGRILVQVEDAVVAGGNVYVRYTSSGGNTQLGAFRSDGDTSTAGLVDGARYKTSADAGGLAILDFEILHQAH